MAGLVVPDSSWFFVELLSAHCVRVGGLNCRGMGIQADQLRIQQDFMVAHLVNLCLRNLGLCMGYFLKSHLDDIDFRSGGKPYPGQNSELG